MFESTSLLDTLDLVKNHTKKEGAITGLLLIRDQELGNRSQIVDLMRSALGSIRLAAIHLPYFLLARLVVNIPSDIRTDYIGVYFPFSTMCV